MIKGSCLCGGVRFEIERAVGPFELCHCRRCRKATGSAFFSGMYVPTEDFRLVEGKELITTYEAPILREPPAYRVPSAVDAVRRCRIQARNPSVGCGVGTGILRFRAAFSMMTPD